MNGDAWTEAQRDLCLAHPEWSPERMAKALSKIGPHRTAQSVKGLRRRMEEADHTEAALTQLERTERRRERREATLAQGRGWPKLLGDAELLRRIAEHQVHGRAA